MVRALAQRRKIKFWGIAGHFGACAAATRYSLVKEHPPSLPGALRARVTNGATFFGKTAFAFRERGKKIFFLTIFGFPRATDLENTCAALNLNGSNRDTWRR
jgi:hypothetical protein